jgi:hypothetical protein
MPQLAITKFFGSSEITKSSDYTLKTNSEIQSKKMQYFASAVVISGTKLQTIVQHLQMKDFSIGNIFRINVKK